MYKIFMILFISTAGIMCSCAQQSTADTITVGFWNLENLFDVVDDPVKNDEEFLPAGNKEWTADRLEKKLYNLARVIRMMGDSYGPDILGVCEIEHQALIDSLTSKFLNDINYKTAALEAPDERGIDNGLIYNSDKFTLLSVKGDTVHLDDGYPTRLILGCTLLSKYGDTICVFVNHWPSRRGGETESEPNRINAAKVLRKNVDSLLNLNSQRQIIIIGDFNDMPDNKSITDHLRAVPDNCGDSVSVVISDTQLYNLAYIPYKSGSGSYKYQDNWNMLDQIIITGNFFNSNKVQYLCNSFEVFKPSVMITRTGKFAGTPFPTYGGSRYLGGYSDHFPVTAKFILKGEM
ncbi:MAG: hypothetical protein IPM56_08660 [Ignavibacteriales bacterium]|nr:MAG: hypothetical protein IPM56_08660 [Ignavibacteriales bacterium]